MAPETQPERKATVAARITDAFWPPHTTAKGRGAIFEGRVVDRAPLTTRRGVLVRQAEALERLVEIREREAVERRDHMDRRRTTDQAEREAIEIHRERTIVALERTAMAVEYASGHEAERNHLLREDARERRESWARTELRQEEQFRAIVASKPEERDSGDSPAVVWPGVGDLEWKWTAPGVIGGRHPRRAVRPRDDAENGPIDHLHFEEPEQEPVGPAVDERAAAAICASLNMDDPVDVAELRRELRLRGLDIIELEAVVSTGTPDPVEVHVNDGSAHDRTMAWSEGHTAGFKAAWAQGFEVGRSVLGFAASLTQSKDAVRD